MSNILSLLFVLTRSIISDMTVAAECLILEPVNLQINMSRNLSAAWYHGHPDIDISGQLDAFKVSVLNTPRLSEHV